MTIKIPRHNPAYSGLIAKLFNLKPGDLFLDLTLGDGGHTQEALEVGATVVSLDIDPESIERAKEFVPKDLQKNWTVINSNMTNVTETLNKLGTNKFKAIMVDLGPSQYQVLSPERGFSFSSNDHLDMRLDKTLGVTAKDFLAALGQKELEQIFHLADEPKARQIAKAIIAQRKVSPINTGEELAKLVTKVKGVFKKTHPATQVFLGLRMAVNLEREVILDTLPQLPDLLETGGTLGVISFHSGEDKLVKQFGKQQEEKQTLRVIYKKPLRPTAEEINNNPRVRSALLRLFEKNDQN
jgi:16S rRNA (cytosine1402-N4)-methyltransferase